MSSSDARQASPVTALGRVWRHIRKRMIEGLLVVLPILIAFWIVWWLYTVLDRNVIHPLAKLVLLKTRLVPGNEELPDWFENYGAPLIGGIVALLIIYCCGALAHSRVRRMVDNMLLRVPVVSHLYDAVRSVFQCVNRAGETQAPQRIVLVPFPHPGMRLPAIVTATSHDIGTKKAVLCVYVPNSPLPTSGFFLMIPEEEVTELNWDVQQTLQTIISGGLTAPPLVSYTKTMTAKVQAEKPQKSDDVSTT